MLTVALIAQLQVYEIAFAQHEYRMGEIAYQNQDYEGAAQRFSAAYELYPEPTFLYNMALVQYKQDNVYAAQMMLKRYYRNLPKWMRPVPEVNKLTDTVVGIINKYELDIGLFDWNRPYTMQVCYSCVISIN